jgi:uncharacterized membrane protein
MTPWHVALIQGIDDFALLWVPALIFSLFRRPVLDPREWAAVSLLYAPVCTGLALARPAGFAERTDSKRSLLLDTVRGAGTLLVCAFHFLFDLVRAGLISREHSFAIDLMPLHSLRFTSETAYGSVQFAVILLIGRTAFGDSVVGPFLFFGLAVVGIFARPFGCLDVGVPFFMLISGATAYLQSFRVRSFWFNAALLAAVSIVVTVVTYFTERDKFVRFGVVHCFFIVTVVCAPFRRAPRAAAVVGTLTFFAAAKRIPYPFAIEELPGSIFQEKGFDYTSWLDMVPMYLLGIAGASRLPLYRKFKMPFERFLLVVGRNSLLVYCAHRVYGFLGGNLIAFTMKVVLEGNSLAGKELGARVWAAKDLKAGDLLIALNGTLGTVVREYSAAQGLLTVQFDERADGVSSPINLRPYQIRAPTLEA